MSAGESDFAFCELLFQSDKVAVSKAFQGNTILLYEILKAPLVTRDSSLNTRITELKLLVAVSSTYSSLLTLELKMENNHKQNWKKEKVLIAISHLLL